MTPPGSTASRFEIVISALIYLMSSYRRTPCERLAQCIAGHLECLSHHPAADPVIREVCAGMLEEWRGAGAGNAVSVAQPRAVSHLKLH